MTKEEQIVAEWEQGRALQQMMAVLANNKVIDGYSQSFKDAARDGIPLQDQYHAAIRLAISMVASPHCEQPEGKRKLFTLVFIDLMIEEINHALDMLEQGIQS